MNLWWILAACVPQPGAVRGSVETSVFDPSPSSIRSDTALAESCSEGASCDPIAVATFPFVDRRDTTEAPEAAVDFYACAEDVEEAGREFWYAIEVGQTGILSAAVDDASGDGVDVDVHLLSAPDPDACVERDNAGLARVVDAGTWYVVVDTWAEEDESFEGPYELTIDLIPTQVGPCAMDTVDQRMYWPDCAAGIDCYEGPHTDGSNAVFLRLPTVGPVVKEAHLVTTADFDGAWPQSHTDAIEAHYAASAAASGHVMRRTEPWAPDGEGGSRVGQGATGRVVPTLDEAWYVNMYWRDRPPKGTRMIVMNPFDGRAVVASGGYETGPGSNEAIAGAVEEIHDVLGTVHRDPLVMGYATDQSLPLGPVDCR